MTKRLVEALERALAGAVQNAPRDASVMVQFAAGDYAEIREALAEARDVLGPKEGIVLEPVPDAPAEGATIEGEQLPKTNGGS